MWLQVEHLNMYGQLQLLKQKYKANKGAVFNDPLKMFLSGCFCCKFRLLGTEYVHQKDRNLKISRTTKQPAFSEKEGQPIERLLCDFSNYEELDVPAV